MPTHDNSPFENHRIDAAQTHLISHLERRQVAAGTSPVRLDEWQFDESRHEQCQLAGADSSLSSPSSDHVFAQEAVDQEAFAQEAVAQEAVDQEADREDWLGGQAADLIEKLKTWSDQLDAHEADLNAREAQWNARVAAQELRERQFRLKRQDLEADLATQQRRIDRISEQMQAQARRLAFEA